MHAAGTGDSSLHLSSSVAFPHAGRRICPCLIRERSFGMRTRLRSATGLCFVLAASVILAGCNMIPAFMLAAAEDMAVENQAELRAQKNPDIDAAAMTRDLVALSTEPLTNEEKTDVQAKLAAMTDDDRLVVRSYLMVLSDLNYPLEKSTIQRIANSKVPDGTEPMLFYQLLLTTS